MSDGAPPTTDAAAYAGIETRFVRAIQAIEHRLSIGRRSSDARDADAWVSPQLPFEAPIIIADPIVRGLAMRLLSRQGLKPGRTARQRGVTFVIDVPDIFLVEVVEPELHLLEVAFREYQSALLRLLVERAFPTLAEGSDARAE